VADSIFTPEQRDFYETNGFIVVRNLVAKDLLSRWESHFQKICRGEVDISVGMTVMKDISLKGVAKKGEDVITKLQDWQDDEILFEYPQQPEILKYVQAFVGSNVKSVHTMLINKPPDPGTKSSRHPLHQDLYYFPFRPADTIVCSWTAMERVTRANGCLVALPGTHKGEMLPHDYPNWEGGVNKMYHGIVTLDTENSRKGLVYLEMEPGDTVFFHPLLIHGSGTNTTKGYRKAISCHYASATSHFVNVEGSAQELIKDEIEQVAKQKGYPINFYDIWRLKSRLIQGEEKGDFELK